ncbi:hypothetical protein N7490_005481 [Penicillium lividum]|nr:hypothetical protein N7490_005481 [Penicillium lividum]
MTETPAMQYRYLGRTGLQVSVIGLGGWLTYGSHVESETAFDCMRVAYESGVNFFDTAEGYAGGRSEEILGQAIKKFGWRQNDLVISTKLTCHREIFYGHVNSNRPSDGPSDFNPLNNMGLSRKHIIEGMAFSLHRLDLPYVDIVYAHRPDPHTPMEEIVRGFNHLLSTGQAFYWGTSEWSAQEITEAWHVADKLGLVGPAAEQPEYNLLTRARVEVEYALLYETRGQGLTVFSPLKQGILTGKYNDVQLPPAGSRLAESQSAVVREFKESFNDDAWERELGRVAALKKIAEELQVTIASLALAWILVNPRVSCMITGASCVDQVRQNVRALEVMPKLTSDILWKIECAVDGLGKKD